LSVRIIYRRKEVSKIKVITKLKIKLMEEKGKSTLEYALVTVIAAVISAILIGIGKPLIIDVISKVFAKIAAMV